jgi:hypothetical protein
VHSVHSVAHELSGAGGTPRIISSIMCRCTERDNWDPAHCAVVVAPFFVLFVVLFQISINQRVFFQISVNESTRLTYVRMHDAFAICSSSSQ